MFYKIHLNNNLTLNSFLNLNLFKYFNLFTNMFHNIYNIYYDIDMVEVEICINLYLSKKS